MFPGAVSKWALSLYTCCRSHTLAMLSSGSCRVVSDRERRVNLVSSGSPQTISSLWVQEHRTLLYASVSNLISCSGWVQCSTFLRPPIGFVRFNSIVIDRLIDRLITLFLRPPTRFVCFNSIVISLSNYEVSLYTHVTLKASQNAPLPFRQHGHVISHASLQALHRNIYVNASSLLLVCHVNKLMDVSLSAVQAWPMWPVSGRSKVTL